MPRFAPVRALVPILLLMAVTPWGTACGGSRGFAGLGGRHRATGDERAAYAAAIAHLPADPASAEAQLEEYLRVHPRSALSDDAAEELARLALIQGRRDDAFKWLDYVVTRYPDGDRTDSVRVRLARWEIARNHPERARELLGEVRVDRLERSDQRALHRLQAQLAEDPVDRVINLAALRQSVADELAEQPKRASASALSIRLAETLVAIDSEIDALLVGMNGEQLGRAGVALRSTPPAGRIRLLLARQALDAGDIVLARKQISQAREFELTPPDQAQLASLELRTGPDAEPAAPTELATYREAAARPGVPVDQAQGTIGVVLPLSGQYAAFGEEALRGIMLAAGTFDVGAKTAADGSSSEPPSALSDPSMDGAASPRLDEPVQERSEIQLPGGVKLVVRDTGGVPERAAEAVRELSRNESVVAIIGPIFSDECEAAAREADALRIPLLTLSNRIDLSNDRDYVFRLRLTPEDEVGFLVDYAFDKLGARRFAVLYPATRYGRGMRVRYWDAVVARGGVMTASAAYDPDATDYSDSIRSMVGFELLTNREVVALAERERAMKRARRLPPVEAGAMRRELYSMPGPENEPLPPIVDFDALFIPDSNDRIQMLVAQLAYHDVQRVQLLGSSEWADPSFVRVGTQHVRGAVIATPFHRDSPFAGVQSFVTDYESSFGTAPDTFSSHAFDATNLVLLQFVQSRTSRDAVRDGLMKVRSYPGVSGLTTIDDNGGARKRPFLLQVQGDGFVALD